MILNKLGRNSVVLWLLFFNKINYDCNENIFQDI